MFFKGIMNQSEVEKEEYRSYSTSKSSKEIALLLNESSLFNKENCKSAHLL